MAAKSRSVQLVFLDHVQERQMPVLVFLLNGVRLEGVVVGHDDFTIQLAYRGQVQHVYKQSISTISPTQPIELWEGAAARAKSAPRMPPGGRMSTARVTRRPPRR
ncbi:MAG TPA: RNA chaperone Hfq [Candidatus Sulfotelmatobacter sp.]|nr:RNA chaperone Hfq [Candidatus Sulfotelmatobacter sp.]